MEVTIAPWGNSLGFRIPKPYVQQLGLKKNIPLNIHIEKGKLILTPPKYSLSTLLAGVSEENIHSETFTDTPRGREIYSS